MHLDFSEALRSPAVIYIANLQDRAIHEGEEVAKLFFNDPGYVLSALYII